MSLMSFLRPLPNPSPSYVRHFLRSVTTTAPRRISAAATEVSTELPASIISESLVRKDPVEPDHHSQFATLPTAQRVPKTSTSKPLPPLAYHVHRTPSQQLPIYHLSKRGGNLHQTRIRKIEGDIFVLKNELQKALELKEDHIEINHLTKQIIIKGWKRKEVAQFMKDRYF